MQGSGTGTSAMNATKGNPMLSTQHGPTDSKMPAAAPCTVGVGGSLNAGRLYARDVVRPPNPRVYMELRFRYAGLPSNVMNYHDRKAMAGDGGERRVRLEIELYPSQCPLAAENFRALCTGERGKDPRTGVELWYRGVRMHKLLRNLCLAGGDIVNGDGTANGVSIYGRQFSDDTMQRPHDVPGCVGMQNNGPNTNGAQFYISLSEKEREALDGRHVNFGRVVEGLDEFVAACKRCRIYDEFRPMADIIITDCGELTGPGTTVYPTDAPLAGGAERPADNQATLLGSSLARNREKTWRQPTDMVKDRVVL